MKYTIASYNKGWEYLTEDTRKIEKSEFAEFVNNDDRFEWIEDVLESSKERQLERFGKLKRQTAVYNFNYEAGYGFDLELHHDSFGGAINCTVYKNKDKSIEIIKEVASYLKVNIYHDAKCIYSPTD